MVKVVIIPSKFYDDPKNQAIINSFTADVKAIKYIKNMTKDELFQAIENTSSVSQVAFLYHYPGYEKLPFFYDPVYDRTDPTKKPKYHYFSDIVIDILQTLRDGRTEDLKTTPFVLDILTCDLKSQKYKEEIAKIETELGINIRYSVDKTGNPSSGANWVLESETPQVNVREVYFTEGVLNWSSILTGDIGPAIRSGTAPYNEYITYSGSTFTVVKDFKWSDIGDNTDYIQLVSNEIFDGNRKEIDLESLVWEGLFTSNVLNFSNAPSVYDLGVLGGTTQIFGLDGGGFIFKLSQSFFKVENCYSTGIISYGGGGIAGTSAGFNGGVCTITNCYSTGSIGVEAGGIVGAVGGASGICTIERCYSTGNIGTYAGGIAGYGAGSDIVSGPGLCTIRNCYSIGVIGTQAGGIAGQFVAIFGVCTIENCYSIGSIGTDAGGIVGSDAGDNGTCNITNCVSNSPINGPTTGTVNIVASSTNLNDINNTFPVTWDTEIWATGGLVLARNLPILKVFQLSPWIFSPSDPNYLEYYQRASDPAQFYSELQPTPIPIVQSEIPPCCRANVCNPNPQTGDYNSQFYTVRSTSRAIATNVDSVYRAINNQTGTFLIQPVFKSYRDYMLYLQSKRF